MILEALGKDKYFELVNEIARKSGTDLKLEVATGQDNSLTGPNQQMQQVMEQIAGVVEQNAMDIDSIKTALGGGEQQGPNPESGTMIERQAAEERAQAEAMAAQLQPQQQQEAFV